MDVKKEYTATPAVKYSSNTSISKRIFHYLPGFLRSPLWLCLLLTLAVRIWLVIHTHAFVDGDENLVGIQAEHILRGEHPIYYYGQPYMGSLEAYLVAIVFSFAGPSIWTLRATTTLLSLVLVCLVWLLAGVLADGARLPVYARRWFQITAGLFAALPPLYDLVIELRTWGGQIEIYICMLCLLLAVLRLTQRWGSSASWLEMLLRWSLIGFIIGVGIWIYPLIASAVLTAILWVLGYFLFGMVTSLRKIDRAAAGEKHISASTQIRNLLLALFALPACLVGFVPGLLYGAQNNWSNVLYLLSSGSDGGNDQIFQQHYARSTVVLGIAHLYTSCIVPHVIGGSLHTEDITQVSIYSFSLLTIVGIICIVLTTALIVASLLVKQLWLQSVRQLALLPMLFGICTVWIFFFSGVVGYSIFSPCTRDGVGRYAAPLLLALPFFAATIFTTARILIQKYSDWQTSRLTQPTPETVVSRPGRQSLYSTIALSLMIVFLFIYLGTQLNTYLKSSPDYTFQSFACVNAPIDNSEVIAYMQREHIHYAWAAITFGNSITFKTNAAIIVVDPDSNRLPANTLAVKHADRPAIIDMVPHGSTASPLLKSLAKAGITYRLARFPVLPGNNDILVITPLNRAVTLAEAALANHC